MSLQLDSIKKLLGVEFEWLLPGKQHTPSDIRDGIFNSISYPCLLRFTFIYVMLVSYLIVSFVNLCTGIKLFPGHGYRIKYKDVQAKNAAMESLLANYTS